MPRLTGPSLSVEAFLTVGPRYVIRDALARKKHTHFYELFSSLLWNPFLYPMVYNA
jgi:hypothetical protein